MEGEGDSFGRRVLKPKIPLIDGGALWSVMNMLKFTPSVPHPQNQVPDPDPEDPANVKLESTQQQQQHDAVHSTNKQVMIFSSDQETKPNDRLFDLQAATKISRSPELFEELMLGKNSSKKRKTTPEVVGLATMESTTNTSADEPEATMASGGSQNWGGDCTDSEISTMTSDLGLPQGRKKRNPPKSKTRTSDCDDLDFSVDSTESFETETDSEMTNSIIDEFFPKGYDPYRRRSTRLEALSLSGSGGDQQTTRHRATANPEEAAPTPRSSTPRARRSSDSSRAGNKKPSARARAVSIVAEALSKVSKKSGSKLGAKAKKTQNNVGRYHPKKRLEEEPDERDESNSNEGGQGSSTDTASTESTATVDPSLKLKSSFSSFNLDNLDLDKINDISQMRIDQLIVCLGLCKNANAKLKKEIEEKVHRRDKLLELNRKLAEEPDEDWYINSANAIT